MSAASVGRSWTLTRTDAAKKTPLLNSSITSEPGSPSSDFSCAVLLDDWAGEERRFHLFASSSGDSCQSKEIVPTTSHVWLSLHISSRKCFDISGRPLQNGHASI